MGIIVSVRFNRYWYEDMASGMWCIVVWLRFTDVSEQPVPVLPFLNIAVLKPGSVCTL